MRGNRQDILQQGEGAVKTHPRSVDVVGSEGTEGSGSIPTMPLYSLALQRSAPGMPILAAELQMIWWSRARFILPARWDPGITFSVLRTVWRRLAPSAYGLLRMAL